MNRVWRIMAVGVWAGTLTACSDAGTEPIDRPPVALIEVAPSVMALAPGDSAQLIATVRAPSGVPLPDRTVTWASSDSTVATVTTSGLVRALRSGVASIRAAAEGRSGFMAIRVADQLDPAPQLSHISPSSAVMGSGDISVTAVGANFASDAVVLWDNAPRSTTRISSVELRATIGANDLSAARSVPIAVRNLGAGATSASLTFTVARGGVAAVTVSPDSMVLPAGGRSRLAARAYDHNGMVLLQPQFTWSSSRQAIASVDAHGEVTALAEGIALITVEIEGLAAQARIEVIPSVSHVLVAPATAAVLVDGQVQLRATPISASGGTLTGRTVTWSSDDPEFATVSAEGLVTGIARGIARVRATIEGKIGVATIEVRQFASGSTQVFELRGPWGSPVMPTVGTTTWVDEHGVAHEASLILTGGTFTLQSDVSRYQQTLVLDIVISGRGMVGKTQWTDEGTFVLNWFDGSYLFTSSIHSATMSGRIVGPGELMVEQAIGTAPKFQYLWVVQ